MIKGLWSEDIKPIVYLYPWNTINLFCGHRDLKEMHDPEKNDRTELGKGSWVSMRLVYVRD